MSELYDEVTDEVSGGKFYRPKAQRDRTLCELCGAKLQDPTIESWCFECRRKQRATIPPISTSTEETILDEARRLVDGARGGDYGHPLDDFTPLGRMWAAVLSRFFESKGIEFKSERYKHYVPDLPAEIVALMLNCVKVNREAFKHKRDNVVDGPGYWYTIELIEKKRAE